MRQAHVLPVESRKALRPCHAPRMRYAVWLVMAMVAASCTASNPRSCKDGLCTDQAYPFCDVDGSISGTPETCVAVICTPSEFGGCRGNSELVCNSKGNDFDLVDCSYGCGNDGCRDCSANEHCPAGKPVCDAGGVCRPCSTDDECTSTVCDSGDCVPEISLLYVASGGSASSSCTHAAPCTLSRALSIARAAAIPPTIRMLPGVYSQGLVFDGASTAQLSVVATGATVVGIDGVTVDNGANVKIRGLSVMGLNVAVLCGDSVEPHTHLELDAVEISAGSSSTNLVTLSNCTLSAKTVALDLNASTGHAIGVSSDSVFHADRLRIHGDTPSQIGAVGSRWDVRITNSLLENVTIVLIPFDTMVPASVFALGYNTVLLASGNTLDCSNANFLTVVYDNNVIVGQNLANVVSGTSCTIQNNVLYPQMSSAPANITTDPQLVSPATGDLHLKPTSPAIDAAASTLTFPGVQSDYDGAPRPHGPKPDIGAYEWRP